MRLHPRACKISLCCVAILACALLAVQPSRAQVEGFECLDGDWASKVLDPEYAEKPNFASAVIRLRIYVVRDDYGQGGATTAEVDSLIAHTRADFAAQSIYFDIDMDTIECSECLTDSSTVSVFDLMDDDDSTLSAAVFPAPEQWNFSHGQTEGIPGMKVWVGLKPGSFDGGVLSHEIGHNLGLYHTFERYCGGSESQLNCDECGDLVCDTIYDTYGAGIRDYVDHESCEFDPGIMIPPTPTGDPLNIMAYSWPSCMTSFTDGQADRMLYFLESSTLLSGIGRGPVARYENKTSDTNLDYEGTPYSSVILDYNADDKKDLFVSMRDDFGSLQKQTNLASSEVPQFTDRTENDIATASKPQIGLRGVAAADYDNDGRVDLFAAADSNPRLYHNNNGTFADSASALGLTALADSSYVGAWGDFDRDGQIDLYVGRAAGGGNDPAVANLSAVRGRLLRNDFPGSGTFVDRSDSLGAAANAVGASVTASWADVEGDGDLDLFVGDLRDVTGSASSRFYLNNGAGSLSESFASRFSGMTIENVNSAVWADMDSDGYLDLVLGSETAPPAVYFNNGSGDFDSLDPLLANLEAATNAVRPVDSDLDGMQDLLAIPRSTSEHRRWFWNQVIGGDRALLDQSWCVGFADSVGRVDGLAMADFNGDGDSDIYFGRPVDSGDVFYRAKSTAGDDPIADWVGVRLVAGGGNNGSAIGASVRFYIGSSFEQVQVVDGGSGKGGQADNVLICGLGGMTGSVSAEIKWPGGFVQTASLTRSQVNTITDETVPGVPSTVSGVYTALPEGQAELTFTWDTAYSCKPSLDKVTITDRPRQPSQCPMGTVVLTPISDNVSHAVMAKAGGGYRHTLTWPLECRAPCAYNFLIESATDATHKSQMAQTEQISTPVCISQ
jgi:hypothetical protein